MPLYSAAELEGAQMFGERERVVLGERIIEPAVGGRIMRTLLRRGGLETDEKVNRVLADVGMSTATIAAFLARREVVRVPEYLGGGLEARPIIPGLDDDSLSNYSASDYGHDVAVAFGHSVVVDDASRKYKLNNLFRDTTLTDKLQISARRLQSAKRLAFADPSAAAAALTDYIREHGFPNSTVLAGDYAKTVNNAIDYLHALGDSIVYADTCAPAVVANSYMEISFDQFHLNDVIWSVRGPLKYATEVNIVYQLAIRYGPEHVLFMAGLETIRLSIDIRNEKTGDYYTGEMHGYSSLSGIVPESSEFPPELTADQQARLLMAGKKISPVKVGDAVIGSAVHVSDKHAIINEHTLAAAEQSDMVPTLCGEVIDGSTSVSGDVCVVRSRGVHAQWHFREPDVGERVVLCYSVGETIEYSEVLQVLGCAEQLVLSASNILRKGASGAAVVALRDSALLGIFSTMRASKVICSVFSSSTFAIVSDCQSVASLSQYAGTPGVDAGNHTYAKMVKRGLLGFLEQIEQSVASLYYNDAGVKRVAGLVANVAGDWHTTVDPNVHQLAMRDGRLLSFSTSASGTYVVDNPPPVLQAVPNARIAVPGERVFVFTKVGSDVVMSSVRLVVHLLADGKGFFVEDFGDSEEEMAGALVVAERDAAVLGMYRGRDCDSFGVYTVSCVSFSRTDTVVGSSLDLDAVCAEVVNWVVPVEDVLQQYEAYGRALWDVAVGRRAYSDGGTLAKAAAVGGTLWSDLNRTILDALGWPVKENHLFDKYGIETVGFAFMAALYLRDNSYVVERVDAVLNKVAIALTPVVGGFPFPRASSATGSTVSSRTVVEPVDSTRLLELEQRMLKLTEMVSEREKRFSGVFSDNG